MRFQEKRFLPTTEEVLSHPRPREFALASLAVALALSWSQISRPNCSTDTECEDWCKENPFSCWLAEQYVEPPAKPTLQEAVMTAERASALAQKFAGIISHCASGHAFAVEDLMIFCDVQKMKMAP